MKKITCYACYYSAFDGELQKLGCRKNLPGCPRVGSTCCHFERYAGAEE